MKQHTATKLFDTVTTHDKAKPYQRLVMAVILQAIRELRSKEFKNRLDAALWLTSEAGIWMDAIDLQTDPIEWLTRDDKSREEELSEYVE